MQIIDATALFRSFEAAELDYWVDGGWGVDALLEVQTRPHSDLDLAVRYADLPAFARVLASLGYARKDRLGHAEWNWVFRHPSGQSVDLHGFTLDKRGNGILGDLANDEKYPADAFNGEGRIGSMKVRCIAAPVVLAFRNGFTPRDVDHNDVAALCARFGLTLPSRFRKDIG